MDITKSPLYNTYADEFRCKRKEQKNDASPEQEASSSVYPFDHSITTGSHVSYVSVGTGQKGTATYIGQSSRNNIKLYQILDDSSSEILEGIFILNKLNNE